MGFTLKEFAFPDIIEGNLYETFRGSHLLFNTQQEALVADSNQGFTTNEWGHRKTKTIVRAHLYTENITGFLITIGNSFLVVEKPLTTQAFMIISGDKIGWTTIGRWFPEWFNEIKNPTKLKYLG